MIKGIIKFFTAKLFFGQNTHYTEGVPATVQQLIQNSPLKSVINQGGIFLNPRNFQSVVINRRLNGG